MASIYKRPGSSRWMARFKQPDGTWGARSTKTENEAEARRLAFLWEGTSATLQLDHPTAGQLDKVVRDRWQKFSGRRIEVLPAGSFLSGWVDGMEAKRRKPKTIERYRRVVDEFIEFLGDRAVASVRSIQSVDVQAYVDRCAAAGRTSTTVSLNAKILSAAFASAVRRGDLERNPAGGVEVADVVSETREPFTIGEVEMLLSATEGNDWHTAVLLGAFAGLRLGDAANLRWPSVELSAKTIRFLPEKTSRKGKTVIVPLHPRLSRHLQALAKKHAGKIEFLCPTLAGRKVSGRSGTSREFMEQMKAAGVDNNSVEREGGGRDFSKKSFHSLRHFFVSSLANSGVSEDVRRKLVGHASAKMTERYTTFEVATLREAVAKLPGKKGAR